MDSVSSVDKAMAKIMFTSFRLLDAFYTEFATLNLHLMVNRSFKF